VVIPLSVSDATEGALSITSLTFDQHQWNIPQTVTVVGVDDVAAVDLAELGQKVPHVNLEIIEPGPEPHAITMRVHERGAGITMACGTGACAAAEAAVAWGLVPASTPEVIVHMDGGDAKVRVDSSTRAVTLIGPAVFVASISVHV
jgi:diaminopimelate epimerase